MANIICIAFPAWEGNYLKSTVQLMKELALDNQVLYVDYAYTWKDFFQSFRGKGFASWKRMLNIEPRLRSEKIENGATIHILTLPPVVPANFLKNPMAHDMLNYFNSLFIRKTVKNAAKSLKMENPVVINAFNPFFGVHLAGKLKESKLIYYCYDEIGSATWAKQHGERLEMAFLKMVDTVIVTSNGLFNKKRLQHANCNLIKNGVDFDLFSRSETVTTLPQKALKTIGYLGSIDERVDYDLLERLISNTPQYQYIFVGRITQKEYEERLRKYPNVDLKGPKPPTELPDWVQSFDVCLIPFVKNGLTSGIYPLKINEYLAAGKPVVTTRFSDLSDFEAVVDIADDDASFIEKVINASNDKSQRNIRRNFASKNSWKAKAQEIITAIK